MIAHKISSSNLIPWDMKNEKYPSMYVVLFLRSFEITAIFFYLGSMIEFELEISLTIVTQRHIVDGELLKFTTAGHFFFHRCPLKNFPSFQH